MATSIIVRNGAGDMSAVRAKIDKLSATLRRQPNLVVGFPRNSMPYPDGTSVIMVAFWNEFGTKFAPERAFMRTAAAQNKEEWLRLARRIYSRAVKQGKNPADFLGLLGERMQLDVQKSIDSGAWEPNKGQYAKWKEAHGKTKPLIVTGHMRGSVRYVLRGKQ